MVNLETVRSDFLVLIYKELVPSTSVACFWEDGREDKNIMNEK